MILTLYILSTLYTNSMGIIIISRCNPVINNEIEKRGYILREKSDEELLKSIIKSSLLFLIPGYYLSKALKLSTKDEKINRIIEEKINKNEVISLEEKDTISDSIFRRDNDKLSIGKYDKIVPYKAISLEDSMYTKERYPNSEDVDMDFWEEEEKDLKPYLEEPVEEIKEVKKEPIEEYLSSITEEELESMVNQLDLIRKLKKDSEKLLNNKAA